jgi:hypothetical protein
VAFLTIITELSNIGGLPDITLVGKTRTWSTYLDFPACNEALARDVCQKGRVDRRSRLESRTRRCMWQ